MMKTVFSGALAGLLVLGLSTPAAFAAGTDARMSARAQAAIEANPHGKVKLIVTYRQPPGLSDKELVKAKGGQVRRAFKAIPGHAIEVPAQAAAKILEHNSNIARVSMDEPVGAAGYLPTSDYELLAIPDGTILTSDGGTTLKAVSSLPPQSLPSSVSAGHPSLDQVPYTGAGVRVAVVDSGFIRHSDISPAYTISFVGKKVDDEHGHGNHVAAILSGDGNGSSGAFRGVAPGVELIAVRALDDTGSGPDLGRHRRDR
jgi:subtilisin family serine protease